MPNRILKESICSSENIDQLSPFEETCFYRLMVNCDDFGRMDARPKILSSRLFPLKDVSQAKIVSALKALVAADLIILYDHESGHYLQMRTWDRHQQVRAKRSKYPAPDGTCASSDSICNQLISDDSTCPRNPIQSNPNPNRNPNPKKRTSALETDENFEAFWSEYPKKVKKPDAIRAWKKIPTTVDPGSIMDGLMRWKKSDQWTRDGGRFIPNPATWLNAQQWNDDVPAPSAAQKPDARDVHGYEQRSYENEQQTAMARMMSDDWGLS